MPAVPVARLHEIFAYASDTGELTWRVRPAPKSRAMAGDVAGTIKMVNGKPYRYVKADGVEITAVQVVWAMAHGEYPHGRVAAINGDGTDLRIDNLTQLTTVDGDFDHSTPEGRSAYLRAHRAANPDHYRNKDLKKSFGIDIAEYQRKFVEQGGVCAICELSETATRNGKAKWLAVDHDHTTGAIRGLLCSNCNPMIGYAKEDPDRLIAAVKYLKTYAGIDNVVPLKEAAE